MIERAEHIRNWLRTNLHGDPVIWGVVAGLSALSILAVYSASGTLAYRYSVATENYLVKHSFLVIAGMVCMYYAHKVDYRYYISVSRLGLLVSIALLVFAYLFGPSINDSKRWIVIPILNQQFQPSDLAKLALIANVAAMLARRQTRITTANWTETLLPILLWCFFICGLIALSNISTAAMLLGACLLLMFFGRLPLRFLAILLMVGMLAGGIAMAVGMRGKTAIARIERFLDRTTFDYQTEQSFIAIANGGLIGKGMGKSHQKNFLPHPYSDFIYAVIIEEYGMIGGLTVLFLYLVLLYRGMLAVASSNNAFGGLLSAGLSFLLALQAMFNMAVAVGLVPVTGQPLPLVSMGGTSLIFTGISFGIILSVSRGEIDPRLSGGVKNVSPQTGNTFRAQSA
jgi:cell division protein FtsW